jgi:hypothetical protein
VTGDVEHGIVTPHQAVGRCVCVDLQVVCCTSPFGECAALCISSNTHGVGFVIAMRMGEEERRVYCSAVGIWAKVEGETYG